MVKLGNAAVAHGAVFGPNGLPYLRGKTNDTSLALSVLLEVTDAWGQKQTNKRVLPNRCCRICSDPGCLSLQAPQLSGEVKKKREKERENENPRNSSLALQHKTKLRLKAHTGSLADSQ